MIRVLAVADEVVDALRTGTDLDGCPDVILAAGDLPFDYLEMLADTYDAPCVFVPGNHDRDLRGYRRAASGWTRAGLPAEYPGPRGAVNADGRTVQVAGLTIAGLGGCRRYSHGPNQYTETEQVLRAKRLWMRAALARRSCDILLTHSPARGAGDGADKPHRGFGCFHPLVRALRPTLLIHGHVHPYGATPDDPALGDTTSVNVVGYSRFDIEPATRRWRIVRQRHGA